MFRSLAFSLSLVAGVSIALWFSIIHIITIIIERVI